MGFGPTLPCTSSKCLLPVGLLLLKCGGPTGSSTPPRTVQVSSANRYHYRPCQYKISKSARNADLDARDRLSFFVIVEVSALHVDVAGNPLQDGEQSLQEPISLQIACRMNFMMKLSIVFTVSDIISLPSCRVLLSPEPA